MSPEVLRAKLDLLYQILSDLKPHVSETREQQEAAHYEIERQVQLSVDLSLAVGRRILLLKDISSPPTAREVFSVLGARKLISKPLARKLSDAVGLRNLVVHEYGALDYDLFFGGLKAGFQAFVAFTARAEKLLNTMKE